MRFKVFKFKRIKSTNNTAIRIIRNSNVKYGMIIAQIQKMVEDNMEKNGFHIGVIYLSVFSLN